MIEAVRKHTQVKKKNAFKLKLKYPQGDPTKFAERMRGIVKTHQQR